MSAFSDSETAYFRVFVLSAGANGYLETSPYARRDENVAGDDIGTVIYERR